MHNLSQTTARERGELARIIDAVGRELASPGRQIYCFEHGARFAGSLTGCGVDQAHLHIVPLPFDLIGAVIRRMDSSIDWSPPRRETSPVDRMPRDRDYVALWRLADRTTMIGTVVTPISQWVRRVIAAELGLEAEWDYRIHPHVDNVVQTLEMLADFRASRAQ
jgi:ATP adenylyltransferase